MLILLKPMPYIMFPPSFSTPAEQREQIICSQAISSTSNNISTQESHAALHVSGHAPLGCLSYASDSLGDREYVSTPRNVPKDGKVCT